MQNLPMCLQDVASDTENKLVLIILDNFFTRLLNQRQNNVPVSFLVTCVISGIFKNSTSYVTVKCNITAFGLKLRERKEKNWYMKKIYIYICIYINSILIKQLFFLNHFFSFFHKTKHKMNTIKHSIASKQKFFFTNKSFSMASPV